MRVSPSGRQISPQGTSTVPAPKKGMKSRNASNSAMGSGYGTPMRKNAVRMIAISTSAKISCERKKPSTAVWKL